MAFSGDHWTPVEDSYNEWVSVGDHGQKTCWSHNAPVDGLSASGNWDPPSWGTSGADSRSFKNHVYCCQALSFRTEVGHCREEGYTSTTQYSGGHCWCQTASVVQSMDTCWDTFKGWSKVKCVTFFSGHCYAWQTESSTPTDCPTSCNEAFSGSRDVTHYVGNGASGGTSRVVVTEAATYQSAASYWFGNVCPSGTDMVPEAECLQAVREIFPARPGGAFTVLSHDALPPGCSQQQSHAGSEAHYNTNLNGNNNGDYKLVCKISTTQIATTTTTTTTTAAATYQSAASYWFGNVCPSGTDMVPEAECLQAVREIFPARPGGAFTVLSHDALPPGCSQQQMHTGSEAHYNTNVNGNNNGDYKLVCKISTTQAR
eukprot:TRINITY_DN10609_c0_g1_i3.p1 TRINITY_DN10609_c0_g1~~TRINITY_DN10609_c0_g1_i3.p1  ORF type:complete len:425 (+),score=43.45 TRINITY_DN10609_c0_g1_i3:160-1275(+)